jgi:hypothetical protein
MASILSKAKERLHTSTHQSRVRGSAVPPHSAFRHTAATCWLANAIQYSTAHREVIIDTFFIKTSNDSIVLSFSVWGDGDGGGAMIKHKWRYPPE